MSSRCAPSEATVVVVNLAFVPNSLYRDSERLLRSSAELIRPASGVTKGDLQVGKNR